MEPFEDLIKELGHEIGVPLHVDQNQSCLINFDEAALAVQIDLDSSAEKVLVGIELGELNPGVHRETVLMHAMKVNGQGRELKGVLAYSSRNNSLVLFQFLPLPYLNGKELAHFLSRFLEHAQAWVEALKTGDLPQVGEASMKNGSTMFGLKP